MLLSTNRVPELGTEPYRIMAHILAEVSTAILLLVSGYGLMKNRSWSLKMFIFAQGSLFYSLIASPGYYLQTDVIPMVIMFLGLLVITLVFLGLAISRPDELVVEAV